MFPNVPVAFSRVPGRTRDAVSPANRDVVGAGDASRDVARVVSDVSVLCPRAVDDIDNRASPSRDAARNHSGSSRPWLMDLTRSLQTERLAP